jgi:hypothetical protein
MEGGLSSNPVLLLGHRDTSPVRPKMAPTALHMPAWAMPVANQGNVQDFIPQGAMIFAVPDQQADWLVAPPFVQQLMPMPSPPQFGQPALQFPGQDALKLGHLGPSVVPRLPSDRQAPVTPDVRTNVAPVLGLEYPTLLRETGELKQEKRHQKRVHSRRISDENVFAPAESPSSAVRRQRSASPPPQLSAATPEQLIEMEMDTVLAQKGYMICRHKVYNPGLPAGVLGKGSFGCVYKAVKDASAPWAVKKIENASKHEYLTRKEIEVLRTLTEHPGIVGLGDTMSHPSRDWMFIIMEFVDGGDLLGALTTMPQLFEEPLVRAMMFHLSCALGFAHETGVMHRDLKPENILLTRDLMPKIADFGLARFVRSGEVCRTVAGTPGYIAPEVLDVRVPYDFPADVFAMGLVFADLMNSESCCHWWMADKPEPVKQR